MVYIPTYAMIYSNCLSRAFVFFGQDVTMLDRPSFAFSCAADEEILLLVVFC
jgi:hypothetical protein